MDDLADFWKFLETRRINSPKGVDHRELTEYARDLNKRKMAKTSVARHFSSLRAYYKFMIMEGYLENDPTQFLDSPKLPSSLPKILNVEDIKEVLLKVDYIQEELGK